MNHKEEADRIKSMFPILNHRLHMMNTFWAIKALKLGIEIMKSENTVEFYERVLKILEDEKTK